LLYWIELTNLPEGKKEREGGGGSWAREGKGGGATRWQGRVYTMKWNEKQTLALARNGETDKAGYLFKRGVHNTDLKKRYFVLRGNLLFYWQDQKHVKDKDPIGAVLLEACSVESDHGTVEQSTEMKLLAFKVVFDAPGK
jgi:hypothetical protein